MLHLLAPLSQRPSRKMSGWNRLIKLNSSPPVFLNTLFTPQKYFLWTVRTHKFQGGGTCVDTQIFGYRDMPCTAFSRGRTKIIFVEDLYYWIKFLVSRVFIFKDKHTENTQPSLCANVVCCQSS